MRQFPAVVFVVVLSAGCSWIYNPNSLDNKTDAKIWQDAPVDVPVDVETIVPPDPTMMMVTDVYPTSIDEGRGTSGSRAALIVLKGSNFISDGTGNLMVMVTPDDGGEVLTYETDVANDHNWIALVVTAPVDGTCAEGTTHAYSVAVSEDGATTRTLAGALTMACHDELTQNTLTIGASSPPMYSQVSVTGALAITGGPASAIIKSASIISITGTVSADANTATAGPGGKAGGAAGAGDGAGDGGGKGALLGGGGAGFFGPGTGVSGQGAGGVMIGDVAITSYAENYASGGGGSGTLSLGAAGGGGGGTIELTAEGDITLGAVSAKGGSGGSGGGAGAGGLIVLRPLGGTVKGAVNLNVSPGASGTAASRGRTRVDGPTAMPITADYHGPMLTAVPQFSTMQFPTLMAVGAPLTQVQGIVINRAQLASSFSYEGGQDTGMGYGAAQAMNVPLTAGWNRVCVTVAGGAATFDIATDCVEMAFLP